MSTLLWVVGWSVAIVAAVLVFRGARAWFAARGERIVACPENHLPAGVEIDQWHAAVTGALAAKPDLHLVHCSRWPEKEDCGQECLRQIETSEEGCGVRGVLDRWYRDKGCAFCGKVFGEIHWHDHKPALLSPDRQLVEWSSVRAERLNEILETHLPVCWDCLIAETFRREFPELVTERPPHTEDMARQGNPQRMADSQLS